MYEAPYQVVNETFHFWMDTNSSHMLGDKSRMMMGDRQIYGRVYIGSEGRGVYFSEFVE